MIENSKKKIEGMVDISSKIVTKRFARATSTITLSPKTYRILMENGSPKGDVLETAKIAGIMAAKMTSTIIPFCHPLELATVKVYFTPNHQRRQIRIVTETGYLGRTGVEMEALLAASVAALTIYDMMKWSDKGMIISQTKLIHKSGGKSGDFNA